MKRPVTMILSAAMLIVSLPFAANSFQDNKSKAAQQNMLGKGYRPQNPKGFNPQPDPPSRKYLGGPDTKSLGGPDTKSLGGPDTKGLRFGR